MEKLLKIIGIVFGSVLAILGIGLLIYTFITYDQWGFEKSAIMEAVAIIALLAGVTIAVLCDRLL